MSRMNCPRCGAEMDSEDECGSCGYMEGQDDPFGTGGILLHRPDPALHEVPFLTVGSPPPRSGKTYALLSMGREPAWKRNGWRKVGEDSFKQMELPFNQVYLSHVDPRTDPKPWWLRHAMMGPGPADVMAAFKTHPEAHAALMDYVNTHNY